MQTRSLERVALTLGGSALLLALVIGPALERDQASTLVAVTETYPAPAPTYDPAAHAQQAPSVPVASRSFMDMMLSAHR